MTKRLLLILAIAFSFILNAQTDEAIGATPTQLSQTYNCENNDCDCDGRDSSISHVFDVVE